MSTNNTKQAAWVAIGNFFSFLVGIVSPMILSRYFSKADYGTYKQVMYVYGTLLTVFTLGLPRAYSYFIPKNPIEQSKSITIKLTKVFVVLGLLFSFVLFSCAKPISDLLNNEDLIIALKLFSPVPLLLLPTLGLEGVYASFQKTQYLAAYTILTRVFTILCVISPVLFFNGNYISAIIGFDVASLLTCISAMIMMFHPFKRIKSVSTKVTFRDIFSFAIPLMVASLWGMIFNSANQFFVSRYFGNEVFAEFSNGFMEIPFAGMVVSAVAVVMLPAFSKMDSGIGMTEQVYLMWNNSVIKSAKIIFPLLFFCIFFPKIIMTCMYGNLYDSSGLYFMIRNIGGLFYIIPFAPIILAIGKTREYSRVHMISAFIIVVLEFVSVKICDSPIAIAIISEVCRCLFVFMMMKVIAEYSSKSILQLLPMRQLGRIILPSIFSGFITLVIVNQISINKWLLLVVSGIVFLVVYYIFCMFLKVSYKEIVLSLLPQRFKNNKIINLLP